MSAADERVSPRHSRPWSTEVRSGTPWTSVHAPAQNPHQKEGNHHGQACNKNNNSCFHGLSPSPRFSRICRPKLNALSRPLERTAKISPPNIVRPITIAICLPTLTSSEKPPCAKKRNPTNKETAQPTKKLPTKPRRLMGSVLPMPGVLHASSASAPTWTAASGSPPHAARHERAFLGAPLSALRDFHRGC